MALRSTVKFLGFKLRWALQPPDTVVVSYPKAGRTWLRVMLGRYLVLTGGLDESLALDLHRTSVKCGLPRIGLTHDRSNLNPPRRIAYLNADKSAYRDKRVLLLTRNAKDTLVSAYFQATKRVNTFDGGIDEFVRDERFGIHKFIAFYRQWQEAVPTIPSILHLSYERMHADPEGCLRQALTFIGVEPVDESLLLESLSYGSFSNMRELERRDAFKDEALGRSDPGDTQTAKVRSGKVGTYDKHLSPEDIAYVDEALAACDPELITELDLER